MIQIVIYNLYYNHLFKRVVLVVVVIVTTLKMARKPVKLQKDSPAGCAWEGKQSKGNWEKRKGRFKD